MRKAMATMLLMAALAGCTATKEMRVRTALTDAGLSDRMAACMARPMAEQLTVRQLQDLSRATGMAREQLRNLSAAEVYQRLSRLVDAPTLAVVTRAGLGCAVRG